MTRLFHFSEDGTIARFEPRPVLTPSPRPPGQDWLNGPLVWAIDAAHAFLYLFPRDCPRILVWPTERSTDADRLAWLGKAPGPVAFVETGWLGRLGAARLHRYDLPAEGFEPLGDVGMWVSHRPVRPLGVETLDSLPEHLAAAGVTLRPLERLTPLRPVWQSSLHASGIRLRNALDWP